MLPTQPKKNRYKTAALIIMIVLIYFWAFTGTSFDGIKDSAGTVTKSILDGLFHPDWAYVYTGDGEDLISMLIQTIAIAFLGTFISAILSLPFAFWAARNKKSNRVISTSGNFKLLSETIEFLKRKRKKEESQINSNIDDDMVKRKRVRKFKEAY